MSGKGFKCEDGPLPPSALLSSSHALLSSLSPPQKERDDRPQNGRLHAGQTGLTSRHIKVKVHVLCWPFQSHLPSPNKQEVSRSQSQLPKSCPHLHHLPMEKPQEEHRVKLDRSVTHTHTLAHTLAHTHVQINPFKQFLKNRFEQHCFQTHTLRSPWTRNQSGPYGNGTLRREIEEKN